MAVWTAKGRVVSEKKLNDFKGGRVHLGTPGYPLVHRFCKLERNGVFYPIDVHL